MKNTSLQLIARLLQTDTARELQISNYQIDSRCVGEGSLFFALPGAKVNGHAFLQEVRQKGAVGAVVSQDYQGPDYGLVLLRVADVGGALRALARQFLVEHPAQVIGVTGSVGKTTTKECIAALLGGKFRVGKSPASYNTKLTLPQTLLNREGGEGVLVLEMGASEPGDISRLIDVAPPLIAVLTKVGLCHVENYPAGLDQIAEEKGKIFSHPHTRLAVFDHALQPQFAHLSIEKISFSLEDRTADYFLSPLDAKFAVDERGVRAHVFDLPFRESHWLHDFLAAVAVARSMGIAWDEIQRRIAEIKRPKMRFERLEKEGVLFINDAYNANPESMRAALSSLPAPKEGGKKIAVLGTMKELGDFSEREHRELGRFAQKYVDHLLVLGEEATPLYEGFAEVQKPAELFLHISDIALRLQELMRPGDTVLVKGSRSLQMETVFNLLPEKE
jgi:UDP-N-acetylmuramoyl-tripeptide--D-alanyl-D-alanine ligase